MPTSQPTSPLRYLPRPVATVALLLSLCACKAESSDTSHSGATNWLTCEADVDCSEHDGASCAADGYCVDESGRRISAGTSSTHPTDGADDDDAADAPNASDDDETSDDVDGDDCLADEEPPATEPSSNPGQTPPSNNSDEPGPEPAPSAATDDGGVEPATDAAAPLRDGGPFGVVTRDAGNASDAAASCDLDSCHPERCDEAGEACCDPFPGDGANYCNGGLACGANGCEAALQDCGPSTCDEGDICCDRCTGMCVNALSGAACPEDGRGANFTCPANEQRFLCGETLCETITSEYCESFTGGPGITTFTCRPLPGPCQGDPSCECLLAELGPTTPETECSLGKVLELVVVPPPAP